MTDKPLKPIKLKSFAATAARIDANISKDKQTLKKKKKKLKSALDSGTDQEVRQLVISTESLFNKRLKEISKVSVESDYGERYRLQVYKALMDMVLELIPIAEEKYRRSKEDRSMYALNVVINQSREIANDMRSVQDFEQQAANIVKFIRTAYTLVIQNFVDLSYTLNAEMKAKIDKEEYAAVDRQFERFNATFGKYLNESLKSLTDNVNSYFLSRPDTKPRKDGKETVRKISKF